MREVCCREDGHSLIEMVIVLTIFSITVAVPVLSFHSLQEKKTIQYFLDVLIEDLRFSQQYAYANETYVYIQKIGNYYYVRDASSSDVLKKRQMPSNTSFQAFTLDINDVGFNGRGNIRKAGTVLINTIEDRYKLVFLIGKGRFYIEEW